MQLKQNQDTYKPLNNREIKMDVEFNDTKSELITQVNRDDLSSSSPLQLLTDKLSPEQIASKINVLFTIQ